MTNRRKSKIGDIAEFNLRSINQKYPFSSILYLDTSSLTQNHVSRYQEMALTRAPSRARRLVEKGDILYSTVRPIQRHYGYVASTPPENLVVSTGFSVIHPNCNKISPLYLYYWMTQSSITEKLNKVAELAVSSYPSITSDDIKNIKIEYPDDIQEQDKIANILFFLDKKIAINRKLNHNLEQMAKIIYDYWFTQFEFPDENGKPYRSSGGQMVWNEQLKRSIPAGWAVKNLLDVVSWESNSQPPKSDFTYEPKEGYIRFIQNRDYDTDTHVTYIPFTKHTNLASRYDILMDKYGDAGAVRYGIEGAFNVALGKINTQDPNFQEYLRSYFESPGIYNYLHNSCMASTRASLSESNLSMLYITIPTNQILLEYQTLLHRLRETILKAKDENALLMSIRDWLLPMLMNGQATVSD